MFGLDTNWGAHPCRRLDLSALFCWQDSLFRLGAHGSSPFMLAQLLLLCLIRYYLGSHIAEVSWAVFLSFLDIQPHNRLPDFLSLIIFPPLFFDVSWALGTGVILEMYLLGMGTPGWLFYAFWSVVVCYNVLQVVNIYIYI